MDSGEIMYEKVYVSPRPPPTISFKDNWMKELDSEVAGSSKDSKRLQPKPKTQLSRTERPVGGQESTKEIEKGIYFDHENIQHPTRTERPEGGQESTKVVERSTLTSEYQDCHMQLWKKQNISEFASLWKWSKIIHIEKHFKPTCSRRITSTTHSAKVRRRWSANWVMWSYSSWAKLFQKYNVLIVFFKALCTALADNSWLKANPEQSLSQTETGCTLYPELGDKRKDAVMMLDMAKPENKISTMWPAMRGRDAARKLTLKVDILQVFTIDFS